MQFEDRQPAPPLKMMLNLGQIVATVQRNCHISDAHYAGDFTLCIFLLKMREFYRWENELPFTRVLPKDQVGEWLTVHACPTEVDAILLIRTHRH